MNSSMKLDFGLLRSRNPASLARSAFLVHEEGVRRKRLTHAADIPSRNTRPGAHFGYRLNSDHLSLNRTECREPDTHGEVLACHVWIKHEECLSRQEG